MAPSHRRRHPDYMAEALRLAPFEQLARRVIRWRLESGISQSELGRRAGVAGSTVARLESGQHGCARKTRGRIDAVLAASDGAHTDG